MGGGGFDAPATGVQSHPAAGAIGFRRREGAGMGIVIMPWIMNVASPAVARRQGAGR
jgi:hypothetical protein